MFGAAAIGRVDENPLDLTIPDEVNYIVGFNFAVHPKVTVGFDFRGRTVQDIARFQVTDVTYPNRGPGTAGAPFVAEDEFALDEPTAWKLESVAGRRSAARSTSPGRSC